MIRAFPCDEANGYEKVAEAFMSARNPQIGAVTVREWSRTLAPRSAVLDLGCGHGIPVSQALIEKGFTVYGLDASPKLIAAFRKRFLWEPKCTNKLCTLQAWFWLAKASTKEIITTTSSRNPDTGW